MVKVQLKIVEEGIKHPIGQLTQSISDSLLEDGIEVAESSNLELKIKFTTENNQDFVLLQLRDSITKHKLKEKVIHYLELSWKQDVASEAHALLSASAVSS